MKCKARSRPGQSDQCGDRKRGSFLLNRHERKARAKLGKMKQV